MYVQYNTARTVSLTWPIRVSYLHTIFHAVVQETGIIESCGHRTRSPGAVVQYSLYLARIRNQLNLVHRIIQLKSAPSQDSEQSKTFLTSRVRHTLRTLEFIAGQSIQQATLCLKSVPVPESCKTT